MKINVCDKRNPKNIYKVKLKKRRQYEIIRRSVLCMLALCILVSMPILYHAFTIEAHANAEEKVLYKYYKNIYVVNGDCVWSIAKEYKENGYENIQDYIYEIEEINQLDEDSKLFTGQCLIIPYFSSEYK